MKKTKFWYLLPALMLTLTACFKDLGNYEYKDINEISISGLGSVHEVLFRLDTLRIEPVLDMTMDDGNADRYAYEWRVSSPNDGNGNKRQLLSDERNLVYPVALSPGNYTLYFNVRDLKTGVTWTQTTTVRVTTAVSTGYYVTGEDKDGAMEVDMVAIRASDTVILKGLLADNGMPRYKKPIRTLHTGNSSNAANAKLWVMSEEGSYHVNTTTFETDPTKVFRSYVFSNFDLPENMHPVYVAPRVYMSSGNVMGSGGSSRIVLTNTGHLFVANLFNGDMYGNPVNRVAADPLKTFKLAPFVFYGTSRWDKYLVYDEENDRFLWGTGGGVPANMLTVLSDAGGGPFPWNQGDTKRKLVYGENSKNTQDGGQFGNSFALMKDDQGDFHIYKFYAIGTSSPAKRGYYPVKPIATDFAQAKLYTFASTRSVLFYAVGSRLYAYDYNPGLEKNYLVHDFGEEITMINMDIQYGNGSELFVATYQEQTGGTIRKMSMGADLNNLQMSFVPNVHWTGLVKVKSMDWRRTTQ